MNKPEAHITTNCPQHEKLVQYAFGELKNSENHLIERHLLNCTMCDDVVEGLRKFNSKEQYEATVKAVNERLHIDKSATSRFPVLSIAAGIALLVGLTIFFTQQNKKEQLAENIAKEVAADSLASNVPNQELMDAPPPSEVEKRIKNVEAEVIVSNGNDAEPTKKELIVASDIVTQKEELKKTASNAIASSSKSKAETKEQDIKQVDAVVSSSQDAADELAMNEKPAITAKSLDSKKAEEISSDKFLASPQENEGSLSQVELKDQTFEREATAKRPLDKKMNELAKEQNTFKQAESLMREEKYEKAIQSLDKIISNQTSELYFDALWQKATCLKKLNKLTEAKSIFEMLSNSNNKYRNQSKEELK
jgi:hypothetical protein